jgi:hypothetical protein
MTVYATSCALALALLNCQPGTPLPHVTPEEWPAIRAAIVGIAVQWEILDEREERFNRLEDLATDLDALRRRRKDLTDAPHLQDAQRFPPRKVVEERLAFNRAYRRQLEQFRTAQPRYREDLDVAIRETDQLFQIWDSVRDLRSEAYYVPIRRSAMKRLKTQIGEEAYATGQLPPHVPIWRFAELK